jgi:ABC-type phosphate/phosphonate transport system substrate-binding protein
VISSLFRDTSEPLMQVHMRPLQSLLESQTGVSGQFVAGGDAENLGQRLKKGELHLGIFHGVEFAWAKAKFPQLRPLVIAVNKQPFLRAHLIVASDSKVASLEDLEGKVVALPNRSREHCRLFLERRCVPEGDTANKYFGRVIRPRDANYAIDDVIDGVAQAAVIDDVDLAAYRKQCPKHFAKVKILQQSESFPCAVIAYYPGTVSKALLDQFRAGMLAATVRIVPVCRDRLLPRHGQQSSARPVPRRHAGSQIDLPGPPIDAKVPSHQLRGRAGGFRAETDGHRQGVPAAVEISGSGPVRGIEPPSGPRKQRRGVSGFLK